MRGVIQVRESVVRSIDNGDSELQWLQFVGDADCPDPWPAVGSWAKALADRYPHLDGAGDRPGLFDAFPLHPRSAVIGLQYAYTSEALLGEVSQLREVLEVHGCSGIIDSVDYDDPPLTYESQPTLHTTTVVGSVNLNGKSHSSQVVRSDLDPHALAAIAHHAVSWCEIPGGAWTLSVRNFPVHLASDQVRSTLDVLLSTDGVGALEITCEALPGVAKTASWVREGRIVYSVSSARTPLSPREALTFSLELLTDLAPHLTYGFAMHDAGRLTSRDAYGVLRTPSWPFPRVQSHQRQNRRLEVSAGWDAFAVILHGPEFPTMPPSAPYVLAESVGDRTLWVHNDAERWMDGEAVREPAKLEDARRALGPCLVPLNLV